MREGEMKKYLRFIPLLAGVMLAQGLGCGPCSRSSQGEARPRLVVVFVLDQFRYDYLVRFGGMFSGGLAQLMREGALFTHAQHLHAVTECAPGYATLFTGDPPAQHGIVGDAWYDRSRRKIVSALEDDACSSLSSTANVPLPGESPHHMLRSTLGDWIKARDSAAQVVSLAGNACAAVFMGGRRADAVLWFDTSSGGYTSSTYYVPALPVWTKQWNESRPTERFLAAAWEKLLPEQDYFLSREDLFASEADGVHTTFPHPLHNKAEGSDFKSFAASPFMDALTLDFAQAARQAHALGEDEHPDLLCIGLNATHAIGNTYGPLSQEMQDNLLRLDLHLGEFIAILEHEIGREQVLIALASDHGVLPLPEELRRRGFEAARVHLEEAQEEILGALHEMASDSSNATNSAFLYNGLYFNALLHDDHAGHPQSEIAQQMRTLSFIADVFTSEELSSPAPPSRAYEDLFRRAYFAGRSPDLMFRRKPYFLIWSQNQFGTASGSAYEYDTHVPLIFWGNGIAPGRHEMPCSTMDFAPTIAHLLDLQIPSEVSGEILPVRMKSN